MILNRYAEAVVSAPINLTSEANRATFRSRHIADAIALDEKIGAEIALPAMPNVLDVGSGNGIPGIVLAVRHPEWHVSLLDSINKKCLFLESFCKSSAINNATVKCTRAEVLAHTDERETYDLVVCRALEKLPTGLELTLPFVKVGSFLIVSHGTSWAEELEKCNNALQKLGGCFKRAVPYAAESLIFHMLVFEKIAATPPIYPRNPGIPTKRPL